MAHITHGHMARQLNRRPRLRLSANATFRFSKSKHIGGVSCLTGGRFLRHGVSRNSHSARLLDPGDLSPAPGIEIGLESSPSCGSGGLQQLRLERERGSTGSVIEVRHLNSNCLVVAAELFHHFLEIAAGRQPRTFSPAASLNNSGPNGRVPPCKSRAWFRMATLTPGVLKTRFNVTPQSGERWSGTGAP